jgi:predicted P-loop ATPase/GTPase
MPKDCHRLMVPINSLLEKVVLILIFFSSLREHREGTLDAALAECSSRCERHPLHKEDLVYLESFNNGNKMGSCKVTLSIQCNVSEIFFFILTKQTG